LQFFLSNHFTFLNIIAEPISTTVPAKVKEIEKNEYELEAKIGPSIPAENQATARFVKNSEKIFPIS